MNTSPIYGKAQASKWHASGRLVQTADQIQNHVVCVYAHGFTPQHICIVPLNQIPETYPCCWVRANRSTCYWSELCCVYSPATEGRRFHPAGPISSRWRSPRQLPFTRRAEGLSGWSGGLRLVAKALQRKHCLDFRRYRAFAAFVKQWSDEACCKLAVACTREYLAL